MAGNVRNNGEQFLLAARTHAECRNGRVMTSNEAGFLVELDLNVEMPLAFKADGKSPNGVYKTERVTIRLWPDYPWSPPVFYLRNDFPRDLPHLLPGPLDRPPRPCLIDGSEREYFFQFGLVELGVFHLVHQLVLWLQRAALGTLIDHGNGWEPTLRRTSFGSITVDADAFRAAIDRDGGYRVFKSSFLRAGDEQSRFGTGVSAWLEVSQDSVALSRDDKTLFTSRKLSTGASGNTVCCLIWPDKMPSGAEAVAASYYPETVSTFRELIARAEELRCGRALRVFLDGIERCFQGYTLETPIPVGIMLCARRPTHLVGSHSNIELLPYLVEIRANKSRSSLLALGAIEPVAPAVQFDAVNPLLLRAVSGAPLMGATSMIGCGSVGSKMAMHLARSGVTVAAVSDNGPLRPHNMARHALARREYALSKAEELALELNQLGQKPSVQKEDVVEALSSRETRRSILPKEADYAINSTASLGVREALSVLSPKDVKLRFAEAALFGRGDGAFLLVEGALHNPTLCDLIDEMNATVDSHRLRELLFDPAYGLTEMQIGQGCGSLTMPMTDMRLSAMTASLTEEFIERTRDGISEGSITVGLKGERTSDTTWRRRQVKPFEVVDIEGPDGWTLRISQRVVEKIREEAKRYPDIETGGVLIGNCSARLKVVTAVDVLDAPPDSTRSATLFVLGTQGLKRAIAKRHKASGKTLFDVGTWHSHLSDQGPSPLDRKTAKALAAERPPPSVLLIVSPNRFYGLMHRGAAE